MQASSASYSTLKNTILEMWEPAAVGVQTAADLVENVYEKNVDDLSNMFNIPYDLSCRIQNSSKIVSESICKDIIFKLIFRVILMLTHH